MTLRPLLLLCPLLVYARPAAPLPTMTLADVSVIDPETGTVAPHRNVVIRGSRIVAVEPVPKRQVRTRVIPAKGKFVIPGLWDMHVHLWHKYHQFPLYIANGVTGVRDMGSDFSRVREWRNEILAGKLVGPRITACGPPIDGPGSTDDPKLPRLIAGTAEEARREFATLDDKLKVDFIKILSGLSRESYFAVAELSRHWYIPLAGHLPNSVSAFEAADARQNSMEHLMGLMLACSSKEEELRKQRIAADFNRDQDLGLRTLAETLDSYNPVKAHELFEKLRRFDIRQTPTLVMRRRSALLGLDAELADPHLRYVERSIRKTWDNPVDAAAKYAPSTRDLLRREYDNLTVLVRDMGRVGVEMLAGTDSGDPYTVPGFALHDELELLVKAGLTPLEALRAATWEPARYFRKEDEMGAVKPNRYADLLLLDRNPLTDIGNTRAIYGVVLAGKYFTRRELDAMLTAAALRASKS